jgi:putative membrane protein
MTDDRTTPAPPAPAAPDRDPDARFLLANERTLLAWLRTGLALQGGGVLVFQLVTRLDAQEVLGVVLLALGAVCHVVGWQRYRAADGAIRANRIPARGVAPDLVVLLLVAIGAALIVALL